MLSVFLRKIYFISAELHNCLKHIIVAVDVGERMRSVRRVHGCAVLQERDCILAIIAVFIKSAQKLYRGVYIYRALMLGHNLCNLDKSACRNTACRCISAYGKVGCAEVGERNARFVNV